MGLTSVRPSNVHRLTARVPAFVIALAALFAAGSCAASSRPAAKPATAPPAAAVTEREPERPSCQRCTDSLTANGKAVGAGLVGVLTPAGEGHVLDGCAGRTTLEGILGESVAPLVGREVWVNAVCTGNGRAAALGAHVVGEPVVDLFVMGLCPAARGLERQIAEAYAKGDTAHRPAFRLHAIVFARDSAGTTVYFAKHGAAELNEDVVQLAVQELEPAKLWPYLGERAKSDEDWETLAGRVGISWRTITEIRRRLTNELAMRAAEAWNDTALNWPTIEASPTVFWRGLAVHELSEVPGWRSVTMTQEPCSN